jgi:hypothetical protein
VLLGPEVWIQAYTHVHRISRTSHAERRVDCNKRRWLRFGHVVQKGQQRCTASVRPAADIFHPSQFQQQGYYKLIILLQATKWTDDAQFLGLKCAEFNFLC